MKEARINVIDVNFALQAQTMRRNNDGIHWSRECNRFCMIMNDGGSGVDNVDGAGGVDNNGGGGVRS